MEVERDDYTQLKLFLKNTKHTIGQKQTKSNFKMYTNVAVEVVIRKPGGTRQL